MLIQGLVDANCLFLDVCVGWPGSVHDARVLAHSALYKDIERSEILPNKTECISGVHVPLYMIGDSAYPLKSWLMKPFPHNTYLNEDNGIITIGYAEPKLYLKSLLDGLRQGGDDY